ncbi:MAG: L-lysine 2,3-aminomutase [Chloroflexi bacterium ADurb.Bin180]|nr:MAG: L-lysine 2,3-aminomutase [Chloroflexi bacterium ADurb.Bin180]HNR95968.1 lysine 2,3-aminomutase [Anaerolineae bacterium]
MSMQSERTVELEEPPGTNGTGALVASTRKTASRRAPLWRDVPDSDWNDWRWQLRHRINTPEQLKNVIEMTPEEEAGVRTTCERLRMSITPYFASLMDAHDPSCPIRRQVVPTRDELVIQPDELRDPLSEDADSPVPGLVHRYPDRVLLLVTDQCAAYCRHCTRRRLVGVKSERMRPEDMRRAVQYIAHHSEVRDVLISGGDPLLLSENALEPLLKGLRSIPHVEIIRIGTRVPVFLPQRITPELTRMLSKYHPLFINIHFNHPRELTPETVAACARLADAGIPLGSQTVLLRGINDCPHIIKDLMQALLRARVRPYYMYQCDLSQGISHFRTSIAKGLEIIEHLRGHTSGLAIPTFALDAPGGAGKVPIMPQYLLNMSDKVAVVRNYAGAISAYPLPHGYTGDCPPTCPVHGHPTHAEKGVAGLLDGNGVIVRPSAVEDGESLNHHGDDGAIPVTVPLVGTREPICVRSE